MTVLFVHDTISGHGLKKSHNDLRCGGRKVRRIEYGVT